MALDKGTRLGPYEITGELGAGGMGEVYLARDTRLDRSVAIKVLPPHLAADDNARQRLAREAKAVSALSHPHICTLYDIGHESDLDFIVIEYLEGKTLSERLLDGPLPLDETLTYGIQIADALDKAHRQNLIHRDLKPGNIMLTPMGAKLLDFGLAKSIAPAAPSDLTVPPTATGPLTTEGSIVGTFQYMAPEQLEGAEADTRTDIFAFGAVLYEMASGRKAFEGKTQASLIASILEREPPPLDAAAPASPPALDRLIRTCMAKDPEERRQSMRDVLLDLQWIREGGSQAGVAAPVARRRRTRARLAWGLAGLLGLSTLALAMTLALAPKHEPQKVVSSVLPPPGTRMRDIALSPDGSRLAMIARSDDETWHIWVRSLETGEYHRLAGTANATDPFWSPDGRSIAFFSGGALKRVDAQGGAPLTLCESGALGSGSWGADGVIVFGSGAGVIRRVADGGGEPVPATTSTVEGTNFAHSFPHFLPDGRRFLFTEAIARGGGYTIRLASVDESGPGRELLPAASSAIYHDGYLVYGRESTLIAQPFDTGAGELAGDGVILAEPVERSWIRMNVTAGGRSLAYVQRATSAGLQITVYDRRGAIVQQVLSEFDLDDFALAPGDRFVAVARDAPDPGSGSDIWTLDLERQVFTRVTFEGSADDPVWSPDRQWIAYAQSGDIYRSRSNGAGQAELLLDTDYDKVPQEWSPDGKTILFEHNGEDNEHLWALPLTDDGAGEPFPILASPFREIHADLSPDGKWLAYASNETGTVQVYVMGWPELRGKWQISRDGGSMPRWSGAGRELFFMNDKRQILAVDVRPDAEDFGIGEPEVLFSTRLDRPFSIRTHQFSVTADAERILVFEPPASADAEDPVVTLVQNPLR